MARGGSNGSKHFLVIAAVAALALACSTFGEDESPPTPATDGGGTSGGSDASAGGTKAIACESAVCRGDELCCIEDSGGPIRCRPREQCSNATFFQVLCDDSADCGSGKVCCMTLEGGFKGVATSCVAPGECPTDDRHRQMCDPMKDDCGPNRSCVALRESISNAYWRLVASVCR